MGAMKDVLIEMEDSFACPAECPLWFVHVSKDWEQDEDGSLYKEIDGWKQAKSGFRPDPADCSCWLLSTQNPDSDEEYLQKLNVVQEETEHVLDYEIWYSDAYGCRGYLYPRDQEAEGLNRYYTLEKGLNNFFRFTMTEDGTTAVQMFPQDGQPDFSGDDICSALEPLRMAFDYCMKEGK